MKRISIILTILLIPILLSANAFCEEKDQNTGPWEKFAVNLGGFMSFTDTNFRIGTGVGISLDMEELLDFDSTNTAFRVDGSWRFTKNRRHRLDLSWFSYNLSGTKKAEVNIPIGSGITVGQTLEGFFDMDVFQFGYSYSFLQDDRIDLAARAGLYVMPIKFGFKTDGEYVSEGDMSFTAPLPVFGLRMDIALAPKWYLRSGTQIFYLEYENFTGSIASISTAVEYHPWKHFGLGLGLDSFNFKVEAQGEDYPLINFSGYVQFRYVGLQLYGRFVF